MHTFEASGGTVFRYNGDWSGDAIINCPISMLARQADGPSVIVPMSDVLELAAEYIRQERISQIEDASLDELAGLIPPKREHTCSP